MESAIDRHMHTFHTFRTARSGHRTKPDHLKQIASMTPLLLLLLLGFVCASPPTEVVVLTDSTFEHDTQAATGQTTGVW